MKERAIFCDCAIFEGIIHLVKRGTRRQVLTLCGREGDTEHHALVFQQPIEEVSCDECLTKTGGVTSA